MADTRTTPDPNDTTLYDLVVIGGSASGLSAAVLARRTGLQRVRVLEGNSNVALPDVIGANELDVGYGEAATSIDVGSDGRLTVDTNRLSYRARSVLVADRHTDPDWKPSIALPASDRIHVGHIDIGTDLDVLVVGPSDHAVELTAQYADTGNRVVLAASGMDPTKLSPTGESVLRHLERTRKATLLYRSTPQHIVLVGEYPLVEFGDRRTPDLQFDHVVFAPPRITVSHESIGLTDGAVATGRVWFVGEPVDGGPATTALGSDIGRAMLSTFPEIDLPAPVSSLERRTRHVGAIEELRDEHYNATITYFEPTHSDLWVLRVKPDSGDTSYLPGQYASLGLGYWEERIDEADDPEAEKRWDKLIRRSYSISSRMFDDVGYLTDENGLDELEFYIVLVPPTSDNTPALTPRLALKKTGDRIYLGPKVAGRYTLKAVDDPKAELVFFSTGTGEAPHNGMVVELLRKGHTGPIISAVTVRQSADLGYADKHRELETRYPNYHYVPMPTREPGIPKRYLQDLIRDNDFGDKLGVTLSPETSHVFLCGNPAMIGLPEDVDGEQVFPETVGVVQLLTERGFSVDQRNAPGNIHFEEYW